MLLFEKKKFELLETKDQQSIWNVGNLASRYIEFIETNKKSHNFNIFIVLAEIPALVSILKRFTIYIILGSIVVTCFFWGFIPLYDEIVLVLDNYGYSLFNNHLLISNIWLNDSIYLGFLNYSLLVSLFKTLLIFYFFLNCFLFSLYYLNSFFVVQKYNSIGKFRGNDLIPDTLDFDHDGIKTIMWKV